MEGQGIEVVPLVSVRLVRMAGYTAPFTPTHIGQAWMLFNEPDWSDPAASDALTPREGAILFRQYSDQLIAQGARIVCCNTLFGHTWNDAMVAEYQSLYGDDARARISVYSFHDYVSVAGGLDAWRAQAQGFIRWASQKPVWMTEIGWVPADDGQPWATQVSRMQTLCAELHNLKLSRVAWFAGFTWAGVERIALLDGTGRPTPLGDEWKDC